MTTSNELKDVVREKYGKVASRVIAGQARCCPAASACCDPITGNLYDPRDAKAVPEQAMQASLGCGQSDGACPARCG